MRLARNLLCGVAVVLSGSITTDANAIPVTDFVYPGDTVITSGSTPAPCPAGFSCTAGAVSFTHDITDDGFIVGTDAVTAATVAIHLMDAPGGGSESYKFQVGASQTLAAVNVPSGGGGSVDILSLTIPSISDLNADGAISVLVRSLDGSFSFVNSVLTAQVTNNDPQALSEPSSLVLFGLGLCGLTFGARRASGPHVRSVQ